MPGSRSNSETLDVIKEEQGSHHSSLNIQPVKDCGETCVCKKPSEINTDGLINKEDVEKMMKEKTEQLQKQFQQDLQEQITVLKERFDLILQNEQIRTSYMLREAHRERQEKIVALQSQLECKNMAALMYVMCAERRRGKLERLRIIEEYTGYIRGLQTILAEGQELILNLSRGFKTAARVDHEWREKMKKILKEFQAYVVNYNTGSPESNQYVFDLPLLLKTLAPTRDDPREDPCENLGEEEERSIPVPDEDIPWWEKLEGDCRPFIMFGDMADFTPPVRRDTLKTVKATKTAPKKWKSYVFHDMYLRADCSNLDAIKDEQPNKFPIHSSWECQGAVHSNIHQDESVLRPQSKYDFSTHRFTSIDTRGNMGSILKIISQSAAQTSETATKANLLGARDSMEITSSTRLKERSCRPSRETNQDVVAVGPRKYESIDKELAAELKKKQKEKPKVHRKPITEVDDEDNSSRSALGSIHNDSLQVMVTHKPDLDHKINYEKVCPVDQCKRMQVDAFMRTLPPYMRASPFMHFEQTFEAYETCSPDQIAMLQARIEHKKKKHRIQIVQSENPVGEWVPEVEGVGVQTSERQLFMPPCTCELPRSESSVVSGGGVYRIEDLLPIKKALDEVKQECFFNDEIEFNRFEVIGQESDPEIHATEAQFKKQRITEIYRILKKHPSLCDLFQANTS